jgi:hypothetical protein
MGLGVVVLLLNPFEKDYSAVCIYSRYSVSRQQEQCKNQAFPITCK